MKTFRIAFATDSRFFNEILIARLQKAGHKVVVCDYASAVLEQFDKPEDQRSELLVTSNFLPYGGVFREHLVAGGCETGIALYHRLREEIPCLPIVIFGVDSFAFEAMEKTVDPLVLTLKDGLTSLEIALEVENFMTGIMAG